MEQMLAHQVIFLAAISDTPWKSTLSGPVYVKGIYAPPNKALLSYKREPLVNEIGGAGVLYHIKHFFAEAIKGTPSVVDLLFTPEEHLLALTPAGRELRGNRALFVGPEWVEHHLNFARETLDCVHADVDAVHIAEEQRVEAARALYRLNVVHYALWEKMLIDPKVYTKILYSEWADLCSDSIAAVAAHTTNLSPLKLSLIDRLYHSIIDRLKD